MSTISTITSKCAVCGSENIFSILCSTNAFGPSDLDTRPPEMRRSTMPLWVQECPNCGYVAGDIDDKTSVTRDFLDSQKYKTCDNISFVSELASMFYKHYLISVAEGKKESAFFALLHAAWACDDVFDSENAVHCRRLSLPIISEMIEQRIDKDKENLSILRSDLLRRSSLFDELKNQYSSAHFSVDLLNQIIAFQLYLADKKDTGRYTVADAVKYHQENNAE